MVTCRQTTRSCTRKGENESKKKPFEMEVAQTYRLPTLLPLLTLLPLPTLLALLAPGTANTAFAGSLLTLLTLRQF